MKQLRDFVWKTLLAGVLVILPLYLAILLLLKAVHSIGGFIKPFTHVVPKWFPDVDAISFLLILILCFLIGIIVRTPIGQAARTRIENSLFQKMPGYTLFQSLTRQLVGDSQESCWKPALAEIEEALVPAFIVEKFDDGRFTVFVPSSPTPVAGTVYILTPERVHPLNVTFPQAIKAIARWGSGSKDLVAAMQEESAPSVKQDDLAA